MLLVLPALAQAQTAAENELPVPQFDSPAEQVSTAGHVRLAWQVPATADGEKLAFELQKASNPAFGEAKTVYVGPDRASFLSGLPDGEYHFRVRTKLSGRVSDWSAPVVVRVQHQSLDLAFTLLGLGAIVVIATIGVVVLGNRQAENR